MPSRKVEQMLEQIKRKQRARGVIEPLVGRHWQKEGIEQEARQEFARDLRLARRQMYVHPSGVPAEYSARGIHYGESTNLARNALKNTEFQGFLYEKLAEAKREKKKIRWLDIGPGLARNFMPFFEEIDPEGRFVDLHTLSPEQILPENKRTSKVTEELPLSSAKITIRSQISNPEWEKWKDRLNHHVGAIETYEPKKLGGKFHAIISVLGGTYYTRQSAQTLVKVAKLLHPKGKAFLHIPSYRNREEIDLRLDETRKRIGGNFEVRVAEPRAGNFAVIVITRLK